MLNPQVNSPEPEPSNPELLNYSRLKNVFQSWFWRYYDHLGHLLLYNFFWVCCLTTVDYFVWSRGWCGSWSKLNPITVFALFLFDCGISVGWAYLVFRIFCEGSGQLKDYWVGFRLYIFKAMGIAGISYLVFLLIFYDLLFYWPKLSQMNILSCLFFGLTLWIIFFFLCCMFYQMPILFFQNPPFWKIYYRSCLLVIGNTWLSISMIIFFSISFIFYLVAPVTWFFCGLVYFFSFQCVVLEKSFIKYKIIINDKPLPEFLQYLDIEGKRGWSEFFRPWEN